MIQKELLELHTQLAAASHSLMERKNSDYTGSGDALANFNVSEQFGIARELGILTRLLDKVKRISVFMEKGVFKVPDESLRDTTLDLINYAVILYAAIKDRQKSKTNPERVIVYDPTKEPKPTP